MSKKLLFTFSLLVAFLSIFAVTSCFATTGESTAMNMDNGAANGVQNMVNGTENAMENAAKGVTDTSKNITGNMENTMNNVTNNMMNNANNMLNNDGTTSSMYNSSRTATRTVTGINDSTFLGMNSTMWTWLILAIAVATIVGLVWYYSTQVNNSRRYDDN